MKPHLLATKFHQPAPPARRVRREHLIHRLDEGLAAGRRLTLISAPAGFGKTTLASEWISALDRPVAWLSLDPADDDPPRFLAYLVAALQRVDGRVGLALEGALQSGQMPSGEAAAAALVNDLLAVETPFLLALDDFQVIQERSILELVERLLANPLPPLHLVLLTREDPLLPLARLRARGQMTEVRAADLRFTPPEVERFLNELMGLGLAAGDIAALEDRTEGWAAGLQLASLALQSSPAGRADPSAFIASLSGSHRYILSYLTDEVLSRQPAEIQDFLLQTSLLDRLTGELCDAVTGRSDSAALLERLYAANLFIVPLDNEGRWYRYHHLFAGLLRSQLSRARPDQPPELHRRAARWHDQAGMPGEAVEHALAAADYPLAVDLLERHAPRLVNQGYVRTVEEWMQAIPAAWHSQSPRANLAFAWMHLLRGSYDRIPPYLQAAGAAIERMEAAPEMGEEATGEGAPGPRELRAEWLALRANLLSVQGQPAGSLELANQALALAGSENHNVRGLAFFRLAGGCRERGEEDQAVEAYRQAIQHSRAAGNTVNEMLALAQLGLMAFQNGRLRLAAGECTRAIERLESGGSVPPTAGAVYGVLGMVSYEWNQLELAREYFRRGLQLAGLGGHNATAILIKARLAWLHQAAGDAAAAGAAMQEAADLLRQGAPAWLRPEVLALQVRLHLARQDPAAAAAALESAGGAATGVPARVGAFPREVTPLNELLVLARLRLALYRARAGQAGELEPAAALAGRLAASAAGGRRRSIQLQAALLRALLRAVEDGAAALDDLSTALALGEPEGYLRTFLDEGPALIPLLRAAAARPPHAACAGRLLDAFGPAPAGDAPPPPPRPAAALAEPLTGREREVLRLMAQGLKYEEIAARLVVSINTVRYHVKAIYGKLHASNRTQAVEAARNAGVL